MSDLEFNYVRFRDIPEYWRLKIKGEVHWSVKQGRCPQCGGLIVYKKAPLEHYNCTKCGVNFVE